jgi:uncharacterized membrane protein
MPHLSWGELHGALTHIPVAFLLAVPVFEIGALLLRKPEWRLVSFWLLVGAVIIAVPSLITGWINGNDLKFTGTASPPTSFVRHRAAAFSTAGLALILLGWRLKTRDQLTRPALSLSVALAVVTACTVGYTGYLGGRMVFGGAEPDASTSAEASQDDPKPATEVAGIDPKLVATGQKLFVELPCQSCHRIAGKGGIAGPDLTHEAKRHADLAWHIAHLKDPQKMKPGSDMPPFDSLPAAQLKALAAYLSTRQ